MPVFGTIASRFNDDGVTALYLQHVAEALRTHGLRSGGGRLPVLDDLRFSSGRNAIVPPARVRYLADVAQELFTRTASVPTRKRGWRVSAGNTCRPARTHAEAEAEADAGAGTEASFDAAAASARIEIDISSSANTPQTQLDTLITPTHHALGETRTNSSTPGRKPWRPIPATTIVRVRDREIHTALTVDAIRIEVAKSRAAEIHRPREICTLADARQSLATSRSPPACFRSAMAKTYTDIPPAKGDRSAPTPVRLLSEGMPTDTTCFQQPSIWSRSRRRAARHRTSTARWATRASPSQRSTTPKSNSLRRLRSVAAPETSGVDDDLLEARNADDSRDVLQRRDRSANCAFKRQAATGRTPA